MVLDTKRATEKTILIVEDDAATGELLCLFLSEETPHRAILVPDGFQALNVIKDITPDLFLLDYRLPRMNGKELYNQLHTTQGLEHIPTIMTSTNALEQETEDPNVTLCIKPFDLDELLTMVEKLLV
jgi:DNA-binding response OmpR family regulator